MPYRLTGISGSLWRFPWGVRRPLVLGHGTPLPSRGGKGVSGLLSSWGRDQGLFLVVPWGSQALLRLMRWCSGWHSSRCRGMRPYLQWTGTSGSFLTVAWPRSSSRVSRWDQPPPEVRQEHRDSFADEAGEWTLISRWGGKTRTLLELWQETRGSSRLETGMLGNFLSCLKGAKYPFEA